MKTHIALVGGQILPVFIGIKEFEANKVYLIISKESKHLMERLRKTNPEVQIVGFVCEPFDFNSIKVHLENIILENQKSDISVNLTGGTKIMLLAAQSVIDGKHVKGYYLNQDYTFLEIPTYNKSIVSASLTICDFFNLNGHHQYSSKTKNYYVKEDYLVASEIENFSRNSSKLFRKVTKFFRDQYKILPNSGSEDISPLIRVEWSNNSIKIISNNKVQNAFKSRNVYELLFKGVWWEIMVYSEVLKWQKAKEILIGFEIQYKSNNTESKNEIDILVNTGNKLIFIECKSGNVKQEDINKIRIIKQTYGGVISKSILVCRYLPSTNIIEKCKELDIELFYNCAFQNRITNPLKNIIKVLEMVNKKLDI